MNDYLRRLLFTSARQERIEVITPQDIPVWKILERTSVYDVKTLKAIFQEKGLLLGFYAEKVLERFGFEPALGWDVPLCCVTPRRLGFTKKTSWSELFNRAERFGLYECPSFVGPLLRLQLSDQQKGDKVYIGMQPKWVGAQEFVFSVVHDLDDTSGYSTSGAARLFLSTEDMSSNAPCKPDQKWVFCTKVITRA